MTIPQPNFPVVNLGTLYINGLQLSNDATTPHTLLDIAAGQARDATNSDDIVLSAPIVLNIAAKGAGGLDTGTVAASKMYYVYLIGSSGSLEPSSVIISLNSSQPVLPFDYDMFRRIGAISTDGSTFIRKFVQVGSGGVRKMYYDGGVVPGSSPTSGSATYATIGTLLNIVPQFVLDVVVQCSLTGNSAGNVLKLQPYGGTAQYAEMSATTAYANIADLMCPCGFNAGSPPVVEIDYETSSGSDTVAFLIQAYYDAL